MYIEQAFKSLHEWWRYLLGFIIIFIVWQLIGSIPLIAGILYTIGLEGIQNGDFPTDIPEMADILGNNMFLFLMLLSFAIGLVGVFFNSKVIHQQSITELTTARKKIDWSRFWFVFILWGTVSSAFVFVDYFMEPEGYVWNFKLVPFLTLAVIAIILVPLQTSMEEYFFRGYLMQGLGIGTLHKKFPILFFYILAAIFGYIYFYGIYDFGMMDNLLIFSGLSVLLLLILNIKLVEKMLVSDSYLAVYDVLKRRSTPLFITSIVFGLMHLANPEVEQLGYVIMVYYIGTGFFLGIMTLMDDGLELALGFHAANNLFTALLVTADWTAFQTDSLFKDISEPTSAGFIDVFMPVFVVFPIILFILAKKYKWTNWSEKLLGKVVEPVKEDYKIIE